MWLFTRHGFFSAVCSKDKDGKGQGVDKDVILLRARRREHLEAIVAKWPELGLFASDIHTSENADYRFRLVIHRNVFNQIIGRLAEDVDYNNFKSAAHAVWDAIDAVYPAALHRVWGVMYDAQRDWLRQAGNQPMIPGLFAKVKGKLRKSK